MTTPPQNNHTNSIHLYYWRGHKNFGDELSPYLIEKITGIEPIHANQKDPNKLVAVGSLLTNDVINSGSIIWGTGTLTKKSLEKSPVPFLPLNRKIKSLLGIKRNPKVYAVRGPLTRDLLINRNIHCPEVYGDPAILLPNFFKPIDGKAKFSAGLILHHSQDHLINDDSLRSLNIKPITIFREGADQIEKFITEVASCEKIFSTSLHGVIVAQAYGIKAQWIRLSNMPIHADEGFKFADYFLGSNQENQTPVVLNDLSEKQIATLLSIQPPPIREFTNRQRLLEAFPTDIV